jgi:hypothetical protein
MEELLESIKPQEYTDQNKLLTLRCLYEYRDIELTKRVLKSQYSMFCNSDGWISFAWVTDLDCIYVSYLLDVICLLNEEQTNEHRAASTLSIAKGLIISNSSLSLSGVKRICKSLNNLFCTVTTLILWGCYLDDDSVQIISSELLLSKKVTELDLSNNNITVEGATSVCTAILHENCKLRKLNLEYNTKINNECKEYIRNLVKQNKPGVTLLI